ncbi:MAG: LON peptidase substrate-binding domain-containing protein, partial [Bacteroidales bacterium]|nr:LON peptidase substrate-binding domain-containing protein [Bacteroidales bacterium]
MSEISKRIDNLLRVMSNEETEIIPIVTGDFTKLDEQDKEMIEEREVPILPLRGNVFFPSVVIPVTAGRTKSIQLIKEAYNNKTVIAIVSQKNDKEDPEENDLYSMGTYAKVIELLTMPDDSIMVILQGLGRLSFHSLTATEPYWKGICSGNKDECRTLSKDADIMSATLKDMYLNLLKLTPNLPPNALMGPKNIKDPYYLLNFVASQLNIPVKEKQKLLELNDYSKRMKKVMACLSKEIS